MMAKGKYTKRTREISKKSMVLLLCVVLLLGLTVGGTIAYVIRDSGPLQNRFEDVEVTCMVAQSGQTFSVTNTGDVDAYIRVAVAVNWMDASNNVYAIKPAYTLSAGTEWSVDDGIYYYEARVPKNGGTSTVTVNVTGVAPSDEYQLSIEVVAEAIQADGLGADTCQEAWAAALGS